jgi:6-phosphogluconolactonase
MAVPRLFRLSVLALCAGVIACGSPNGLVHGSGGGGGGTTQTGSPVYVTNNSGASVSIYQLDQTTGLLQRTIGSPVTTGGSSPDSMATDPAKKFLLVANTASSSISVFSVNSSTAALSPVTGSPFSTPANSVRMVMHPSGNFVYTLGSTPGQILGYGFNSTTGALTLLTGFPISLGSTGEMGLAISSNGSFLYTSNPNTNGITSFAVGSAGGLTLLTTTTPRQGSPSYLTFDTSGNFLFGVNVGGSLGAGSVSVFSVSLTGALSEVTTSPTAVGTTPVSAVFSQGSLYVVNQTSNTVSAFAVNSGTGQLTQVTGSPYTVGARPIAAAAAALGRFLIVTSSSSSNGGSSEVFAIAADGTLTQVTGSPFTPDTPVPDQVLAF